MKEIGLLNSDMADIISRLGHMDELVVCDAGFPIPLGVRTVDISLAVNRPTVMEVLEQLLTVFSVEKIVVADETCSHSPSLYASYVSFFGDMVTIETVPHSAFKERSKNVKAVIRTGDFTAYANILLVSGAGDRWFVERS